MNDLEAAVKDRLISGTQGTDFMDRVCLSARKTAEDAIDAASARGGNARQIREARQALARGDERRAAHQFKDAIAMYKDAVSKAEGA